MTEEELFKAGFLAGFNATGEGWNGGCTFGSPPMDDYDLWILDDADATIDQQAERAWQKWKDRANEPA